jgi:hypothetical protein
VFWLNRLAVEEATACAGIELVAAIANGIVAIAPKDCVGELLRLLVFTKYADEAGDTTDGTDAVVIGPLLTIGGSAVIVSLPSNVIVEGLVPFALKITLRPDALTAFVPIALIVLFG